MELGDNVRTRNYQSYITYTPKGKDTSLGGLEPPTFRLTAERANRLRHRDSGTTEFVSYLPHNFIWQKASTPSALGGAPCL